MKRSFYIIFLFLAVVILVTGAVLFFSFKDAKKNIHIKIFDRTITNVESLTYNYKKELLKVLPKNENWYEYLKANPNIQKHLENELSLLATKNIKYVYLLGVKNGRYYFLVDGSQTDKAEFGEIFEPMDKKGFLSLKPHYFFHKKLKSVYLTYLNPVVVNHKIKAIIVMDLPMSFLDFIKNILNNLTIRVYIILFFSFLLFVLIIFFAYFDFKREKEKEKLLQQLQEANKTLSKKIKQKVGELRQKDALILNQGKLASLGEMLNMIAHQWRQPLNAMSAGAIRLDLKAEMEEDISEKEISDFAKFVQEETQKLSSVIDDFMNFSKPDEKKEEFYVSEVIEDVLKMIKVQLLNHNIEIKVNVSENLHIKSYKKVIENILLNLISNARDALDEVDIKNKEIVISSKEAKDCIEIKVYDNAGKIPKDIAKRIFEPYFTTKEQGKGTGIGLYMSKKLAEEKLKGKLEFENKEDGVEFILKLRKEK